MCKFPDSMHLVGQRWANSWANFFMLPGNVCPIPESTTLLGQCWHFLLGLCWPNMGPMLAGIKLAQWRANVGRQWWPTLA